MPAPTPAQKEEFIKKMKTELEEIDANFHSRIEEHGHCYDRPEGSDMRCDCEISYDLWVQTKEKYKKLGV